MKEVLEWVAANPEIVGLGLLLLESILMPFVPVKWNGLAVLVLRLIRVRYAKTAPAPREPAKKTRKDQIVEDMEKAVNDFNKKSASDKLGE